MSFEEWLSEIEGVSSRAERLYEDFMEVKDLSKLRKWLKSAYEIGWDAAKTDSEWESEDYDT